MLTPLRFGSCLLPAFAMMLLSHTSAQGQDAPPDFPKAWKDKGARIETFRLNRAPGEPAAAKLAREAPKSFAPSAEAPNDPFFKANYQWDYAALPGGMNAIGAWDKTKGSKEVVVAVLSTGILPKQPDIAGSPNLLPGYSFVSANGEKRKADATDPGQDCSQEQKAAFQGTQFAGTIGAVRTNNGVAIAGLNWEVSVLPIRITSKCQISAVDLFQAMLWAAGYPVDGVPANQNPAHIIFVDVQSSGACTPDKFGPWIKAIEAIRAKGAVIVAPAGDQAADVKDAFPASCPGVISVAASSGKGQFASYSNFGNVTLLAPGGDPKTADDLAKEAVWSVGRPNSQNQQGIALWFGTDTAAAHVSGAIALALAQHPDWRGKPDLIEQKLRACAVPASASACPKGCGAGQLDAAKLVDGEGACATSVSASASESSSNTANKAANSNVNANTSSNANAKTSSNPNANTNSSAPASASSSASIPAKVPSSEQASGTAPAQASGHPLAGEWFLPEGDGVLIISVKGEWIHPRHGVGRLREANDEADTKVFYNNGGFRCSYRTSFTDGGKTLVLMAADNTQDSSYCPAGELKSAKK